MAVLLGRTSAGATSDSNAANFTAIWKVTAVASGTLTVLKGQTKVANAGLTALKLGIYLDVDGTAANATLMTTQAVDVLADAQGTGVFQATLASPQAITNGLSYFLGWRGVGETLDWQGDASGSYNEKNVDFTDPYGGASAVGTRNNIIWGEDAGTVTAAAWGQQPSPPFAVGPGVFNRSPQAGFQPWDTGTPLTQYTDAAEGQIVLSGSKGEAASIADSSAGMILLKGSTTDLLRFTETAVGLIRLLGSEADLLRFAEAPQGMIRLLGSSSDLLRFAESPAGLIRLLGSTRDSLSHSTSTSGLIQLQGANTESFISGAGTSYTDSASGLVVLTGVIVSAGEYQAPTQQPGLFVDRRGRWGRSDHGLGIFWDGKE